jgi:hypothetical protein
MLFIGLDTYSVGGEIHISILWPEHHFQLDLLMNLQIDNWIHEGKIDQPMISLDTRQTKETHKQFTTCMLVSPWHFGKIFLLVGEITSVYTVMLC